MSYLQLGVDCRGDVDFRLFRVGVGIPGPQHELTSSSARAGKLGILRRFLGELVQAVHDLLFPDLQQKVAYLLIKGGVGAAPAQDGHIKKPAALQAIPMVPCSCQEVSARRYAPCYPDWPQ